MLAALCLTCTCGAKAEDHDPVQHDHAHSTGIELGTSNALVFNMDEKSLAYGLHLHGTYTLPESDLALVLGYERVLDEHRHQTLSPLTCYRPAEPLSLCLPPGVTFDGDEANLAAHAEASYEFEVHGWHLGPAAEVAYGPENTHLNLGPHTGIMF